MMGVGCSIRPVQVQVQLCDLTTRSKTLLSPAAADNPESPDPITNAESRCSRTVIAGLMTGQAQL